MDIDRSNRPTALTSAIDRIDLWLVMSDEVTTDLVEAYAALLSADELARAHRFYFERDRRMHVIARALMRSVLSRYAPIAPDRWRFVTTPYGKPVIDREQLAETELSFNLSHTKGLIAFAVRHELTIGVDVECVSGHHVDVDLADRFFSREEAAALASAPAECRPKRFIEYWTLKESYIKARGAGLSIPLDQFAFRFSSDETLEFSVSDRLGDAASRWRFWQMKPDEDHVLALCAERAPVPETVTIRRCLPLVRDELVTFELLRRSGSPGRS